MRRRRGRWVADFRDADGRRRWISRRTKREAELALEAAAPSSSAPARRRIRSDVTLRDYSTRWLRLVAGLKPRSLEAYRDKLDGHLLPAFGAVELRRLDRGTIREFLAGKRAQGYAADTVRLIHATLRALLNAAVDDELIASNPAARLGRTLRLGSKAERSEKVRALNREQLARLIAHAEPDWRLLWFLMSRTGLRVGEALALKWSDVSIPRGELRLERKVSIHGELESPKSGHGRTVDLSSSLRAELLAAELVARDGGRARARGWLFPSPGAAGPRTHSMAGKAFRRAVVAAELPEHFSPHSLRHTFASILLAEGTSPAYVQEQLGHSSIELTVGLYGRWLRKRAPGALDALDLEAPA